MKVLILVVALFALASADIASESLAVHNAHRSQVGVPALSWSSSLAASALRYAQQLHRTNTFQHSGQSGVGENLAKGYGSMRAAAQAWADEKRWFKNGNFPNVATGGKSWHDVGHYTQMVWRNTRQVGCGQAGNVYVCHYQPQGNFMGQRTF